MIKRQDVIAATLGSYLSKIGANGCGLIVAKFAPILMVLLYLRNIHGSIRYDQLAKTEKFSPSYENCVFGRFMSWILSLSSLFVLPFWCEHVLEKNGAGGYSGTGLTLLLIGPILVYAVWNCLIWFSSDATSNSTSLLDQVVTNWFRVDALCLAGFATGLVYWIYCKRRALTVDFDLLAVGVAGTVAGAIFLDYVLNRKFYFPSNTPVGNGRVPS